MKKAFKKQMPICNNLIQTANETMEHAKENAQNILSHKNIVILELALTAAERIIGYSTRR